MHDQEDQRGDPHEQGTPPTPEAPQCNEQHDRIHHPRWRDTVINPGDRRAEKAQENYAQQRLPPWACCRTLKPSAHLGSPWSVEDGIVHLNFIVICLQPHVHETPASAAIRESADGPIQEPA